VFDGIGRIWNVFDALHLTPILTPSPPSPACQWLLLPILPKRKAISASDGGDCPDSVSPFGVRFQNWFSHAFQAKHFSAERMIQTLPREVCSMRDAILS